MRAAVLIALALALAGCEHLYGGIDSVTLSDEQAVQIVRAYCKAEFGRDPAGVDATVKKSGRNYEVSFSAPEIFIVEPGQKRVANVYMPDPHSQNCL